MVLDLYLLSFEQSFFGISTNQTTHWGFFLTNQGTFGTQGVLHHASKDSYTSGQTEYEFRVYTPTRSHGLIKAAKVATMPTNFTDTDMQTICKIVSTQRSFNLATNNCQKWCTEILEKMIAQSLITVTPADLQAQGFVPLWSAR